MEFYWYMASRCPDIQPIMFRQRPMYKVGPSYVMFTAAAKHFSVHSLNFDIIETFKAKIPRSGDGRGCVKVPYTNLDAWHLLKALCDEVIWVNRLPNPPPVDVVPELPYPEKLQNAFSASKAAWQPLYERLLAAAKMALPVFTEYFPAVGILWKHRTTFALIGAKKTALTVGFYADRVHEERKPAKIRRLSTNRVEHIVEIVNDEAIEQILIWLKESYDLTRVSPH